MPADQGPVVQSALLCRELANLRRERELTHAQVAAALGWSSSKLIKIEGGYGTITTADLDALLAEYGITEARTVELFHSLHRGAHERAWWDSYAGQVSPAYLEYAGYGSRSRVHQAVPDQPRTRLAADPAVCRCSVNVSAADARWVTPIYRASLRASVAPGESIRAASPTLCHR